MMHKLSGVYLDENATATPNLNAARAATDWILGVPANASSVHYAGRRARGAIERSRRQVAESLGVNPRHLTFCSGATEGLHTLIRGHLSLGDHAVVSAVEHPAVWGALESAQVDYTIVPVNREGAISPQHFVEALRPDTKLVIMMSAQNELGVIYPIKEIASAVAPIPLLCDAVQAWGKIPLQLEETGATFAVLSGHKIGAPIGVGVIWSKGGHLFQPLLRGGSQERGRRAGTENVAAIVGIGVAAEELPQRIKQMERVQELRDALQEQVIRELSHEFKIYGAFHNKEQRGHSRLPNTLSLGATHIPGDLLLQSLDLEGYYLSSGAACTSGALEPSPVLLALGLTSQEASRGIRISLSPYTTEEEIWCFFKVLKEQMTRLIHSSPIL